MGSSTHDYYTHVWEQLKSCNNITNDVLNSMTWLMDQSYKQNKYSKPMLWIGIYIALASLFCIVAMAADLIHGFLNRKLWFPCKYFTLNAASLTVIAVAVKLPVDLNNSMPGEVDQIAKLGSMAFLCTMMANLLPSLATMDNKELFTNIVALDVLVITLVVNVCIQIKTGVIMTVDTSNIGDNSGYATFVYGLMAIIYAGMLLMLLIIHTCSALTIPKSKQILESKYKVGHETALKNLELQETGRLSVEKLKQHVSNYWIMAVSGNPQFMAACSATTSASGVICAFSTLIHTSYTISIIREGLLKYYASDYNWSILVILVIQFIGVIVGTIAPLFRCFTTLSLKLSIRWIWNHIKVFKVERYWTQKLKDWKHSSIPFSISNRKSKIVIHNFKILTLSVCIGFQKIVVVACKILTLIPIFFVTFILYCIRSWNWLKAMFSDSRIVLVNSPAPNDTSIDHNHYVLQHQEDMDLAERTIIKISNSVNNLIKMAEKQQPNYLMKLLEGSINFEGVDSFVSHQVPPLLLEEPINCWSLPVVTMTSIALSLPKIQTSTVNNLLRSVSEGLVYVIHVEENLNGTDEYVSVQKAAKMLWLEIEVYHNWLGKNMKILAPRANTAGQILQEFKKIAKNIVSHEVNSTNTGSPDDNSIYRSINANSMYRITKKILLSYDTNIEWVSQEELFMKLSSIIADILAACLTNLPRVIAMKCHESKIEKREASVHVAAQLLGETTQIINILQDRELPSLNPDKLPFMDKWRDYLKHPYP